MKKQVVYIAASCLLAILLASCNTTRTAHATNNTAKRDTLNHIAGNKATVKKPKPVAGKVSPNLNEPEKKTNLLVTKYAAMLNVPEEELDNIGLLKFMDSWYSVPYKYGGNTKNGIDCSGFTCMLMDSVFQLKLDGTSASLKDKCTSVKKSDLQQGDLVFFKIRKGRISHVGVYIGNNYFIHASTRAGVILSNLDEEYYKKYYCCAGRVKENTLTGTTN